MQVIAGATPWSGAVTTVAPRRQDKENRPWMVVHDPSGDFAWRHFREIDLASSTSPQWEDGTIFWHRQRGELRIWKDGAYHKLMPRGTK